MSSPIAPKRKPLIDIFIERNSQINLSAIREPQAIYTKHILDSLELTKIIHSDPDNLSSPLETRGIPKEESAPWGEGGLGGIFKKATLLDIGTGGGFPLLPLAITYPHIHCTGLDSRKKKLTAIQAMIQALDIPNADTLRGRAEDLAKDTAYKQSFDIVTSRATAYADNIFARSLPFVKTGGYLVLYKLYTEKEDNDILGLIRTNNMTLITLHHYTLPDDQVQRVIYVIRN